jgi:hypothetical protein
MTDKEIEKPVKSTLEKFCSRVENELVVGDGGTIKERFCFVSFCKAKQC